MGELVTWRSQSPSDGYFEVNGVRVDVPPDAEPGEVKERLTGRTIIEMQWNDRFDCWYVLLSDGQIAELSGIGFHGGDAGAGVRFWWSWGA